MFMHLLFSQSLLKSRPLDPLSERKLKEIRTNSQHLDRLIREVDKKLDTEWDEYQLWKHKRFVIASIWIWVFWNTDRDDEPGAVRLAFRQN